MRIKLDENLPESAIPTLTDAGHDTDTTHAEGLNGAGDPQVLAGATADGRLLITLDRGLGDIPAYPPGAHGGVLVIRLDHQSPREIRRAVERISTTVDLDDLAGCIAVWRNGDLRVRRAPEPREPGAGTMGAQYGLRDAQNHGCRAIGLGRGLLVSDGRPPRVGRRRAQRGCRCAPQMHGP